MKAVITRQKYKCDFCKKRGIKTAMEKHERRCFRNPNRFCDYCKNKGYTVECYGDLIEKGDCGLSEDMPCPYCSLRDLEKEKAIAAYEASLQKPTPKTENSPIPF